MIHVTIYKNDRHECMGFHAAGHAGMAEAGQDIVCAAASMLIINTLNALERYTEDLSSVVSDDDDGVIDFRLSKRPTHDADLLLKTLILGLEDMACNDDYCEYISVDFEEV